MNSKNRVGLGTFPLAGVFSKIRKKNAEKIITTFLDEGGYYFDTAPLYGFGEVEELLGKVLSKYSRKNYYLITKCGYIDVEGKTFQTVQKSSKFNDVIRECEQSLQRLKTNYIDLYFVHSPDPKTPFKETMRALTKLHKDGKIRQIGVSNVNLQELKEYNKMGKVKYIQNRFSLINRSVNKDFKNYIVKQNIRLIPYQPIERGQLSNKALNKITLQETDLRYSRPDWQNDQVKFITQWVKENLYPLALKLNLSLEQLAIAWALHQPYSGFVIVGATQQDQVKNNLKANKIKLTPDILLRIEKAYLKLEKEIKDKYHQSIREFRGLNEKFY